MTPDPLIEACRKLIELEKSATEGPWFQTPVPVWIVSEKRAVAKTAIREDCELIAAMRNVIRELAQGYINRTEALEAMVTDYVDVTNFEKQIAALRKAKSALANPATTKENQP